MRIPIEKKSYLIVDDFGDMRSMMRSMLGLFGVTRIDAASNGSDAIEQLEANRYDVVLCDYNLGPGKDGQQVLEESRHRNLIGFGTVFVMVTAESTPEMVLGAIEYQPDAYLAKPFTKDLLRNRLEKLLIKKQDLEPIEKAVSQKKYRHAIVLLDERISKKPKNLGELTRLKSELCIDAGEYDQALEIFERVLAARDVPSARLGLGRTLFMKKRYREAMEVLQHLLETNERMTAAYDWLARCYMALGDLGSAQEVLISAVNLSPKAILRQKALGDVAMKTKSFQVAESAYTRAVRLGKHSVYKHPSTYSKLAESQLSNEERSDKKPAMEVVRLMEKEFGRDREAKLYAAMSETMVYSALGDESQAAASMERAEQLYERMGGVNAPELALSLAKAASVAGNEERAEALFRQAVKNNHDNDVFLQDVEAAYSDYGKFDDAKQLIADLKQEIVDLNNKGVQLAGSGKIDQAIGLFEEAAEGMVGNRVINLNAAKVLVLHMERNGADADTMGKARKYIERTRKLSPDDSALAKVVEKYQRIVAGG